MGISPGGLRSEVDSAVRCTAQFGAHRSDVQESRREDAVVGLVALLQPQM